MENFIHSKKISLKTFYIAMVLFFLSTISIAMGYFFPIVLFVNNLFLSILTFYKIRRLQAVFLLYFFLFTYLFTYIFYYFFDLKLGAYTVYQSDDFIFKTLIVWTVFLYTFYICLKNETPKTKKISSNLLLDTSVRPKAFFFTYFIASVIVCSLLLNSHNVILTGENKYQLYLENLELIGGKAVLFIVLLCLIYCFGGFKKRSPYQILFFILIGIYCYLTMTRGTRMLFASMCFCLFVLFFEGKFKLRTILLSALLGFVFLAILNNLKHAEGVKNSPIVVNPSGQFALVNNQSQILYGGAAIFGGINDNLITIEDRVNLAVGLILELILPPTLLPDDYKYPAMLSSRVDFGGGGLFIFVVYLSFGYVGVCLVAIFLGYIFNRLYFYSCNSFLFNLFGVILLSLSSRWISYDFNVMYRLPIYGILVYLLLTYLLSKNYYENSY